MEKESLIEKKEHKRLFKFIKITITTLLIITLFLLYSRFISTSGIDVKEYKVTVNTEYDFNNIKVVHISDIHYGRTTNKKQLEYMVNKINETKPDLVVFTGDLIDKDTKLTENIKKELTETLKKINSKLGKYAIKGDHDYKFSEFDKIITDAGFTNLTDTYDLIYNQSNIPLMIVGFNSNLKSDNLIENKNNLVNEAIKDIKYKKKTTNGKMFWYLVVATIPAAIAGFLLDDVIENVIRGKMWIIATCLAVMGLLIFIGDKWASRHYKKETKFEDITLKQAVIVGISQAFAVIPGFSRSGTTILAGRLQGISKEAITKFTFLLSVPVICGATILKVTDLALTKEVIIGIIVSFATGVLAIKFLLNYIKKHDFSVFAFYRVLLGIVVLVKLIFFK